MHSVDELSLFGLNGRTILPLKRAGWFYVEDLLGTSPVHVTVAHGPSPRLWHQEGVPIKVNYKGWQAYRFREPWSQIDRISKVGVQNILQALAEWKQYQRDQKGKPVADTTRFPV